jgi:exodeoxyribonuclease V alpha subunit
MSSKQENIQLTGILKKVLYQNDENRYCIAVLEDNQKICGNFFDTDLKILEGEKILLNGYWTTHQKYGKQFSFLTLEIFEAEIYFFLTKIVKGIGKKLANKLLEKYDESILCEILDNRPSELLKVDGIKQKKLIQIVTSWNKFKHLRQLGSFLGKYKVSSNLINKIYQEFGEIDNIIEKITKNPYMLTSIKGIGFRKSDEIAKTLGIDQKSSFRIEACMKYVLKDECDNNGNSSISKEKLFSLCDKNLNFEDEDELYEQNLTHIILKKDINQTTKDRYSPSMLYHAEKKVLEFFQTRAKQKANKIIVSDFDNYIKKKEKTLGFTLHSEQKKAVKLINNGANIILLVGYAGTGKTTSSKALLELLNEYISFDDIKCMALSGIASRRITDTTGYNSATILSELIKMQNSNETHFPYKAILLDEASMVNSVFFYKIISKISPECVFIIVGDDGQLPSIGAGDILADAIKYKLAPVCKLKKIYRQNDKQAIATIANDIRKGEVPNYKDKFEDFSFLDISIPNYYQKKATLGEYEFNMMRQDNNFEILQHILNIASNYLKEFNQLIKDKNIAKALTLFQIITPIKSGILGVENINTNIQNIFNLTKGKAYNGKLYNYKLSDKVIHIKNENMKAQSMNEYKNNSNNFIDRRIFNGQLGMIIKLDFKQSQLIVLYPTDDTVVFYDFDMIDNLISLAYCLTIHKTQGMEYDTALIPMTYSHFIMHNTKLLYTAVTRAKKMCYIVGEDEAFKGACRKKDITVRQTVINDILSKKDKM